MKRPVGISDYDWECKQAAIKANKARARIAEQRKRQEKAKREAKRKEAKKEKDLCEIVYAIAWSLDGPVKIGITDKETTRLNGIQTGCPYKLSIMYSTPCSSRSQSAKIEKWCHERLQAFRMQGEWFDVSVEQAEETIRAVKESI